MVHKNVMEDTREQVRRIYFAQLGVREGTGRNTGAEVEQYLKYTGLGKGYAWCASFVCWVYGKAGVENPRTAWAAGLFPKRRLLWQNGRGSINIAAGQAFGKQPEMGDIFGLYYPSLKRIGHCGFVDHWGEKEVITVEGNTNNDGSREDDGVYRKRRPVKSIHVVADWIGKGFCT